MSEQPVVTSPPRLRNSARSARRRREGRDTTLRRGGRHRRRAPRSLGRVPEGPVLGDHGPVRLGEVDVHAHPRRPRPAHRGIGQDRRHRDHRAARQGAHPAAARQGRVRLPVLQPAADADGGGEHRAAAVDRRAQARSGVGAPAARGRRPDGPADAPAVRALGRPAAARRDRARAAVQARRGVRRRADRQPRLEDEHARSSRSCGARPTSSARRSSWSRTTRAPPRSPTACCS